MVLTAGLRWRVGNGASIRVTGDPWIPVPYTFRPTSHHAEMPIFVRDLIDPDTKQWNGAEVERLFNEAEAKMISGLSLSRWGCPDKLVWHFTKHGGFTVKSAYEVAQYLQRNRELGRQGQGESSACNRQRPLWVSIWKLQVPPKIRNFLWRACLNALAVRQNLRKRHVDIEDVCSLCDGEGESQVHLFFQCEFARMFWFAGPLQLDTRLLAGGDFLSCWQTIIHKYEKEDNPQDIWQWVAFGLWRVWKARNAAVFEGHFPQPYDVTLACQKQIEEFVAARRPSIPLIQDQPRPPDWDCSAFQVWQKPADGWLKFNCDGAWTQANMRGGAGWVARDCNGWMEMAGGVGGFSCQSALAAEAEAVREAVAAGLEARVPKMLVETDCKQLVAMLYGHLKVDTGIDGIIHDIQLLASRVGQVSFLYVNRRCNAAAHIVAAHVSREGGRFLWDQLWPEWLFDTLAIDVDISLRF